MKDKITEIDVLLATYNGEKYLREFLESLAQQQDVSIKLRVSDDGSSDSTLQILKDFSNRFRELVVTQGPKKGPCDNFLSLIKQADSDIIALADQDDIWEPKHLINSIRRLENLHHIPALTFSSVSEFDGRRENRLAIWPKQIEVDKPFLFYVENLARGCTIVFNRSAMNMINKYTPNFAIMHDWWITLLISLTGEVRYCAEPEVNYRIHQDNFVGRKSGIRQRLKRFTASSDSEWPPVAQLREIYTNYGSHISPSKLKNLELIVSGLTALNFQKRIRAILTSHRFRICIYEDIWVRILLMVRTIPRESFVWFLYNGTRSRARKLKNLMTQDFPAILSDFRDIKIHKKHLQMALVRESNALGCAKKVALVALYPRGPLLNSVKRLITTLLDQDFEVIAIVNQSVDRDWTPDLSLLPITLIERQNIGRDFGAFKCGVNYLLESGKLETIDSLLTCNDSVFYGYRFRNFLERFDVNSDSWITAFLNFEKHTHAQSFFQSFSKDILRTSEFQKFWKNYYPSRRRIHIIDRGEVRLSQTLLKLGYFPRSIVNAENIAKHLGGRKIMFDDYFGTLSDYYYEIVNLPEDLKREVFWHYLQRSFMEKNCSHFAGLLAFKSMGAPFKLDLVATGRVTIEAVREALLADGLQLDEIDLLSRELLNIRANLIGN